MTIRDKLILGVLLTGMGLSYAVTYIMSNPQKKTQTKAVPVTSFVSFSIPTIAVLAKYAESDEDTRCSHTRIADTLLIQCENGTKILIRHTPEMAPDGTESDREGAFDDEPVLGTGGNQ